ncbi:hypothetical protein B0T11DRAFT_292884 [Plectosphaerella cucumerina]|uniref:Uncharacterized protein n=1 Tax=Plectosphaerella cucumerina TaxID=40658 RepID=A0A8K0TR70_9PEZI|nr:hypothetical protein B0T11DRAFT_292884 [Plectosphaerella cucumerina]
MDGQWDGVIDEDQSQRERRVKKERRERAMRSHYQPVPSRWDLSRKQEARRRGLGDGASDYRVAKFDSTTKKSNNASRTLACCWDIPGALTEFSGYEKHRHIKREDIQEDLACYMVLQGVLDSFVYCSTKEYLESTWGDVGLAALRIVAGAVSRTMFGDKIALEADESGFSVETKFGMTNKIHFQLLPGLSERQSRLESALRWLCAAVRRPPAAGSSTPMIEGQPQGYENFVWSTVKEEPSTVKEDEAYYDLFPWSPAPPHSRPPNPSCWTDLFAKGVIMESSISRTWGQGLETSFSAMVTLAGVENIYQINGGIILLGFFTALVPISRHEETNSIQWHLETSESGIDPRHLECTNGDWFRTTDIDTLKEARCFIGWFEKAHVMLGTRQLATDEARTLRWTGLQPRRDTIRQVGHEIGAQGGFSMGPINLVTKGTSVFENHANELHYSAPRQFLDALRRDRQNVALVIDAESRRAWLVPLVSWILHLCHKYYIQECGHGDTPIPFAEPSTDGAEATFSVVKDKGGTVVFGAGTGDEETLRQLWLRISTNLGEPQPGREDPQRGLIFAAEAMDIMHSRNSYLKEFPTSDVSASWAEFAKLAKTTTVCANLGNAIVPVPPSGKLCECCTLLESQDFLAAHTWSLARLLEVEGRSFSHLDNEGLPFKTGTTWRASNGLQGLWTDCPAGEECRNIWGPNAALSPILQRLERVNCQKSKGKGVEEEPPVYDRQAAESGVVVFGGYPEPTDLNTRVRSFGLFAPRGMARN